MANNQIVISRIQNRRGIRENLPQPLLPGEFALTVDTGELWIGTDPNQPPFGLRTYSSASGDISAAEGIADDQVVSAKFSPDLDQAGFDSLVTYLRGSPTPAVVLDDTDILWDERATVFIAADTSVNVANTIANIVTAVTNSGVGIPVAQAFDALGAINNVALDPTGTNAFDPTDGDFLFTVTGSNAIQGANASTLINKIHGTQLVTTLANLQVTTSGIGVGTPTFSNMTVTDTDSIYTWSNIGTASADSVVDTFTFVSGDGIDIDIDPALDALRITNTIDSVSATPFTLDTQASMTSISGLIFNLETSDISDVVILDYSLNIDGASDTGDNYTAIGTMMIVGSILVDPGSGAGTATLADNQVEVRESGLTGVVNFEALYVAGSPDVIQIQYTSTFTPDVSLKVLRRRWASF